MKYWCTNTEYSADIGGYICTIMNKPCPYLKPYYTKECVKMVKLVELGVLKTIMKRGVKNETRNSD
ncbi:MAG: hypothetical protein [Bacteriophage sp.]|nr:MAG: hypothetical protein [Bacteriophage sp.]UWI03227.1 MAG: hypothetical protein [Bacteriophage sp.]